MGAADVIGDLALAMIQSSLVALPRPGALKPLARLRAPAWSALLPGSIVVGTALPLWHRSLAMALVVLAAASTPLLAALALTSVARGRRVFVPASVPLVLGGAVFAHGLPRQLSFTAATALAALSVGVGLTRLMPRRWLLIGIATMAALDALLLAIGVGETAAGSMASASARFHGPALDHAAIGPATLDYPDLVLAAVLGGTVAGTPVQRRAATTLAVLDGATSVLLAVFPMVPATVPVALTVVRLEAGRVRPALTAIARTVRRWTRPPQLACEHPRWRGCAACAP